MYCAHSLACQSRADLLRDPILREDPRKPQGNISGVTFLHSFMEIDQMTLRFLPALPNAMCGIWVFNSCLHFSGSSHSSRHFYATFRESFICLLAQILFFYCSQPRLSRQCLVSNSGCGIKCTLTIPLTSFDTGSQTGCALQRTSTGLKA